MLYPNNQKTKVRTRFAPSPTGELHVGGARTALFGYLFAKKNQGQFILRIEDTDLERNREEFVNSLYQDLLWLDIKPDESIFQEGQHGSYRQTQRLEIYRKQVDKLIKEKKAYYCFCSPAELALEKENYIKEKQRSNYQYSRKCLQLGEKEVISLLNKKIPYVIRLKIPRERDYSFSDLVRGEVPAKGKDIEDFVLFRQNGIPNFNFSNVIDDHLMEISHVLRGEEHLPNTGKQLVLYEAFSWEPPQFGHLSIILNKEKKKLSKRDLKTSQFQLVNQLRGLGYLPAAVVNYLLFLGWHPGQGITREIFSLKEAVENFSLSGLHASGAVYDLDKLNWYNNCYIQKLTENEFGNFAWQFLGKKHDLKLEKREWVKKVAELFRSRLNYFQELITLSWYFFQVVKSDFIFPELEQVKKKLNKIDIDDWNEINIEKTLDNKKIFPLLRMKLTNEKAGPELVKIMTLLGKETVLKRLN